MLRITRKKEKVGSNLLKNRTSAFNIGPTFFPYTIPMLSHSRDTCKLATFRLSNQRSRSLHDVVSGAPSRSNSSTYDPALSLIYRLTGSMPIAARRTSTKWDSLWSIEWLPLYRRRTRKPLQNRGSRASDNEARAAFSIPCRK